MSENPLDQLVFDPGKITIDGEEIHPEELVRITIDKLDKDLMTNPSTFLHIGAISVTITDKMTTLVEQKQNIRAQKYERFRALKAQDKSITEDIIKARLDADPDLQRLDLSMAELRKYSSYLDFLIHALRMKSQHLCTFGSRRTEELRSAELYVGGRKK
jgi:hypothetical protein